MRGPGRSLIARGPAYSSLAFHPQRQRPSPLSCRVGVHIGRFEACSTFTRVTACLLAAWPEATRFSRRLRRLRYLPMNSPGWRAAWGDCAEAVSGSSVGRRARFPLAPSIANRCRRMSFLSVVHGRRHVARWRPPRSTRLARGQWTEFEAHRRRLALQRLQHIGLHFGLVLFHRLRDVLLAVPEHPVDQTR